jgi:hypothetical protein
VDRGPMALFGAIVAIGLGPAMWLGAQFGQATLAPERPPAVSVRNDSVQAPRGGSGAGDAPTDTEAIRTEPKANNQPLKTRKTPPPATTASPSPSASDDPSTPPTQTTPPRDPEPTDEQTDPPPTEETTQPEDPPTGDPDVPPVPPVEPGTQLASGYSAQV